MMTFSSRPAPGVPAELASFDAELRAQAKLLAEQRRKVADMFAERAKLTKCDVEAFRARLPEQLRVLIVTPCDDGHRREYWESIRALERAKDPAGHVYEVWTPPGDSLIPRARNNYHHDFRHRPFDIIGWLDSDLDFRPPDVWRIVSHRLPIVAGRYAIKERETRWCLNAIPGEHMDPKTGLQKVATAGTGALFIHRQVDEDMLAVADLWPHWPVRYQCDTNPQETKFHLYHHGVIDDPKEFSHSPRDMSEDWSFCYFARKLGYDIFMDHGATFLHVGSIAYPLNVRRVTQQEEQTGHLVNPDGSTTPIAPMVPQQAVETV